MLKKTALFLEDGFPNLYTSIPNVGSLSLVKISIIVLYYEDFIVLKEGDTLGNSGKVVES